MLDLQSLMVLLGLTLRAIIHCLDEKAYGGIECKSFVKVPAGGRVRGPPGLEGSSR